MGQATELGWVIEKGDIATPEFFTVDPTPGWSEPGQHMVALRLEREEDAEAIVSAFIIGVSGLNRDDVRVAQHGWA